MTPWPALAAVAVLSFAIKAAGPVALGGRELPPRARAVIGLMAPALLAGFVVVDVAGPRWSAVDPAVLAGLAAVPVLRLCRLPLPAVLVAAAAVTALVRGLGG
ncbi:AzlD domain-containing protein [Streptomyces pactum]|uniref:AzlD domain-containing protein n=1 Tax=Streptomyces pactum TaxID=68249 RepID=A0ABS0NEM2_9ACTN|nr:AzlD domain-containing protein [Streptomyces pactum]MBH5333651.1 AzlD domain-containing protein [Streptomyces pactum]